MTLSIESLYVTLSINDTEFNNFLQYSECRYAECRGTLNITKCEQNIKILYLLKDSFHNEESW